jgi:hypothetical protein
MQPTFTQVPRMMACSFGDPGGLGAALDLAIQVPWRRPVDMSPRLTKRKSDLQGQGQRLSHSPCDLPYFSFDLR